MMCAKSSEVLHHLQRSFPPVTEIAQPFGQSALGVAVCPPSAHV
jgi:hypothetical protein